MCVCAVAQSCLMLCEFTDCDSTRLFCSWNSPGKNTSYCLVTKPHGLQHARLPCPSLSPRISSISLPLSQWYHPTISFSVAPFSSCPQPFPASGSFPKSWPYASGGQSIGASASTSALPMNIQGWFSLGLIGLISLQPKELSRVLQHHSSKASIPQCSAFLMVQLSDLHMITWITALCNSMKLWAMLYRASQDGQVMVDHSDKMWSTGEGNCKPLQHSYLNIPMNNMKKNTGVSSNSLFHGVFSTPSGEGNGNPLQYSCLENSMNGGAWWATVHGVTKSWTRLYFHFHFPGGLPHPGIKSKSLHCWKILYHLSHQGILALNIATQKYRWK